MEKVYIVCIQDNEGGTNMDVFSSYQKAHEFLIKMVMESIADSGYEPDDGVVTEHNAVEVYEDVFEANASIIVKTIDNPDAKDEYMT